VDISKWSGIVVAVIAAAAATFQARRRPDPRGQIKADIEIFGMLPKDSTQSKELRQHVDRQVKQLIDAEARTQRDWQGVGIAAFLLVTASAVGYLGQQIGGAWTGVLYGVAGLIALIAITGFFLSIGKTHRDAKGNRVPAPAD
jgi:uncharacterized membrane protein YuzA (DUF378 family)